MMRLFWKLVLAGVMPVSIAACNANDNGATNPKQHQLTVTSEVLSPSFVGNGAQWGGYDNLKTWTGSTTLSEADWATLCERVRYMRPPLMRIMTASQWIDMASPDAKPEEKDPMLFKILDFCQAEGITVMFGEWGHKGGNAAIDTAWLSNSAHYLDYLLNNKGYSCIKYFNMVNEPNGDWSSIDGNYPLWRELIEQFHLRLQKRGLLAQVQLIGPDVAVWDTNYLDWVINARADLDSKLGAYDIHTYPTEEKVRNGDYQRMIAAYKNATPATKPMLMGELGFKYSPASALGKENARRIAADKNASEDSNMMIYDAFYGVDMADAVVQNMAAGYAGVIVWMLDDAMYTKESNTHLKRWGFWNIMGEEKFGNPQDENIRPWFYTMSLLSRYFPQGTTTYKVSLPNRYGIRAVAGVKDGKHTIALVNSHVAATTIKLGMQEGVVLKDAKVYTYTAGEGAVFAGRVDEKGFALPSQVTDIDLHTGWETTLEAQSFVLITSME